jgi:hypothetical protein
MGYRQLADWGIRMYHYSYVFPKQVYDKVGYYKAAVSMDNCIDNYYRLIYERWMQNPIERGALEHMYNGVHEFKPWYRGPCFTAKFNGEHPEIIQKNIPRYMTMIENQFRELSRG